MNEEHTKLLVLYSENVRLQIESAKCVACVLSHLALLMFYAYNVVDDFLNGQAWLSCFWWLGFVLSFRFMWIAERHRRLLFSMLGFVNREILDHLKAVVLPMEAE